MTGLNKLFSLKDISEWPLNGLVDLPKVQRGFVWKPYQIEDLWDSLLRQYPIGAFVLSPKINGTFDLLDGQQRATAICLGFGKETFRDTEDKIKIFIDLEKPQEDDNRKFLLRVITKSHPWGYQRSNNKKTLDSRTRRDAMELYGMQDYLDPDLSHYFPYDSSVSIPLSFMLDAAVNNLSNHELLATIFNWALWEKVKDTWFKYQEDFPNLTNYKAAKEISDEQKIEKRVIEIYKNIKEMLAYHSIPALSLTLEKYITGNKENTTDASTYNNTPDSLNENRDNEIENLFLRLNSSGTPLSGEELNYSILKAHISADLQNKIEKASFGFSRPSRFITIVFRLFQHKEKQDLRDGLNMRIKPRQFQKIIHQDIISFQNFLNELIEAKSFNGVTLLSYINNILEYNDRNKIGLPHFLNAKIADTAPEIMFLLLYRLYVKEDRFTLLSNDHRKLLGIITLFWWMGKGEKNRDHSKLLRNVWPAASALDQNLFWSSVTVKRAMLDDTLLPIPTFNKSRDRNSLQKIKNYTYRKDSDLLAKYYETEYGPFALNCFYNRDLIIYAQRAFLTKIFHQVEFYLDDTNLPFDWDHISADKFSNKHGIAPIVKQWYNTIGNFRAWPYTLNRSDQDVAPAKKLDPLNSKWIMVGQEDELEKDKKRWNEFVARNNKLINSIDELSESLMEWSVCNTKWLEHADIDLKNNWQPIFELVRDRGFKIIEEWYSNFLIEGLIPKNASLKNKLFVQDLDQRQWELNPKWIRSIKADFNCEEHYNWVLRQPIKYNESDIHLFILHSKSETKMLREGDIKFGVFSKEYTPFINMLKIPEKLQSQYIKDNGFYVQGFSTLISELPVSRGLVFRDFRSWLNHSIFRNIKPQLIERFDNSLSKQTRLNILEE